LRKDGENEYHGPADLRTQWPFTPAINLVMPSLTVENYVKAIFTICSSQRGEPAGTGQLATALGVAPGTVTSMLKTLSESNLATYTPYEGVRLTAAGSALALRVVRRHRLIELFLVKTLALSWDEVHEEAEHMEHAVSDWLIDRIDASLGHPQTDPHGDPIPSRDGSIADLAVCSLAECQAGERFSLSRVVDQSPEFLRYLSSAGLALATVGDVVANRTDAGIVTVRIGDREVTLGREPAAKLLVTKLAT
jgi:DtxR family Mn-dependent transcriptional regulator